MRDGPLLPAPTPSVLQGSAAKHSILAGRKRQDDAALAHTKQPNPWQARHLLTAVQAPARRCWQRRVGIMPRPGGILPTPAGCWHHLVLCRQRQDDAGQGVGARGTSHVFQHLCRVPHEPVRGWGSRQGRGGSSRAGVCACRGWEHERGRGSSGAVRLPQLGHGQGFGAAGQPCAPVRLHKSPPAYCRAPAWHVAGGMETRRSWCGRCSGWRLATSRPSFSLVGARSKQ